MAQFTIYRSTDSGAPTLSGTAGSLITVLDAVLVNGYGAKAAAGWTKAFSGTNKAAYKNGGGCQMYFRIDDSAPSAGTLARIRGFETMSDVDTGTGAFPTTTQQTNGLFILKSSTADSTNRPWIILADSSTCYCFFLFSSLTTYTAFTMGEFYSFVNGDNYRNLLIARTVENTTATGSTEVLELVSNNSNTTSGHYFPRGHTGLGGSVAFAKLGDNAKSGGSSNLLGAIPFTNPEDGGLYLSPLWISDLSTTPIKGVRGRLRGLWHFLHPITSVADGDTVTGTGSLNGRTFLFIKQSGGSALYTMETSNTLETN